MNSKSSDLPIVSVIMATYNRSHLISRAIDSVLAQTFQDLELIIIDDGSSDGTGDVVAKYRDPRIIYRWQERGERSRARNAGVGLSHGRYIAFLDSDDWYLPNKLSDQITALRMSPVGGLALGGWQIVDETGRIIQKISPWENVASQPTLQEWLFASLATPITVMVNRAWLDRVGGFDNDICSAEDTEWFIRLSLADCPVIWTKGSVAVVLAHSGNSLRNYPETRKGRMIFLNKVLSNPDFLGRLGSMTKEEVYANYHLSLAWQAYESGYYDNGTEELLEAVNLNPRICLHDGESIRNCMIGHTQTHLASHPEKSLNDAFAHLPDSLAYLRAYYRDTLAKSWMSRAWRKHQMGYISEVRTSVIRAIWYKAACLKDRGIQSMLIQSIIGPHLWNVIRKRR